MIKTLREILEIHALGAVVLMYLSVILVAASCVFDIEIIDCLVNKSVLVRCLIGFFYRMEGSDFLMAFDF